MKALLDTHALEHKDPFDRMLAAQSWLEDLPLVSTDSLIKTFGVNTFW